MGKLHCGKLKSPTLSHSQNNMSRFGQSVARIELWTVIEDFSTRIVACSVDLIILWDNFIAGN